MHGEFATHAHTSLTNTIYIAKRVYQITISRSHNKMDLSRLNSVPVRAKKWISSLSKLEYELQVQSDEDYLSIYK